MLRAWVEQYKPAIVTLSETWLTNKISNNEIELADYVLYRVDRGARGGGVSTYVSSNLVSELIIPDIEPLHFECIFVKITLHANKYITIGNIYRPPSAPAESINYMISTINSIKFINEIILLGDFNKNWLDKSAAKDKNSFGNLNLTQLISEPTRVTPTCQSLLDWILVSHPNRFLKSGIMSDCFSDHAIVYCILKIKLLKLPPKLINIRQYNKLNLDYFINDIISINWDRYQLIPNVQDAWDFLFSELNTVIDKHAPLKTNKVKGRHLPWISADLIRLFRQRDAAWAIFHKSKNPADWDDYRRLRNLSKTMTRNAKSNYYKESLIEDFKNPKQFWSKIKSITNASVKSVPKQIKVNNEILQEPLLMAQAFNTHFSSVSSIFPESSICGNLQPNKSLTINSTFSFRRITPVEVQTVINDLKMSTGSGLDGIEARFLKLSSHVLMYPLCDLFNMSLSTYELPNIWKCSRIIPLH